MKKILLSEVLILKIEELNYYEDKEYNPYNDGYGRYYCRNNNSP
jgi:hypothetical protein